MDSTRPARDEGFILVATLFVVALIALGAAYFASRVDSLRAAAQQLQVTADAERDAFSTRQTLMHAATVNPRGLHGLEVPDAPLIPDGRPYRLNGSTVFTAQDERGLVSLNVYDERFLRRFLTSIGVPTERQNHLLDALADYEDIDDLKRLNGAEKNEYALLGLPPPANDFLVHRDDLWRVAGWSEMLRELDAKGKPGAAERFLNYFSANRLGGININTAPRTVLLAVPGLDPARVGSLMDRRRTQPFATLGELAPYAFGALDDENTMLVGANTWRVAHDRSDLPFLLECRLVMSPAAIDRPAQVNECRRRPRFVAFGAADADEIGRALSPLNKDETGEPDRSRQTTNEETRKRAPVDEAAVLPWLAAAAQPGQR